MKILHIVPTYFPAVRYGGPIYSVHGLCRGLVGCGAQVHVFTTNVDGNGDSDVPLGVPVDVDGVQVWYFPSRFLRRLYYAPQMLKALRQRIGDFDIVHLHSVFLWPTWAAARLARSAGVPYVLSPRGMLVGELIRRKSRWVKLAWLQLIEKSNIEHAAAIHVTGKLEAEALQDFSYRFPLVAQIPNGVEMPTDWHVDELREDVRKTMAQGPYVLYFGRINWKKGLDRLLQAWADVPDWKLVIAGNDEEHYLPTLTDMAKKSGIANRVCFLPRSISGADKEALLTSASLLVLPSYSENFGNVVPEAMVRGVPVVVTPEVGAAEVVRTSGGGLVVEGAELARIMVDLLHDETSRIAMGIRGKDWIEAHLTWKQVGAQMLAAYRRVVEDGWT